MRRFLVYIAVCLCSLPVVGQYFNAGQPPNELKWRQINTAHFQLIYPEHYEEHSQLLANKLEAVYDYCLATLKKEPRPISIILQTQTAVSNGFVAWAPSRSEFEVTPPQDNDVIEWLDLLAVHEYRHVIQISQLNVGFTKLLTLFFGEQGVGASLVFAVPPWFLEGDATLTETLLTTGGRGRIPQFTQEYRALVLEGNRFSYPKAMFGSYKDYVPNHYHLGYHMTSYARKHYGPDVWHNTLERVGKFAFLPYRFPGALRKETGIGTEELYKNTIRAIDSLNRSIIDTNYSEVERIVGNEKRVPLNYSLPVVLENKVYAFKSGYAELPTLVQLDEDGNEEALCLVGPSFRHTLNAGRKKIVWAEVRFDKRWERKNFSVLVEYDIETGKKKQLTSQSRYFAPDISSDDSRIVCVHVDENGASALKLLDAGSMEETHSFPCEGKLYRHPRWSADDKSIVVVEFTGRGNSIVEWKQVGGEWQKSVLLAEVVEQINYPTKVDGDLYYAASYNGIDNVYCLQKDGQVYQVSNRPFGAFYPFVTEDGMLYFSDYKQTGYELCSMEISKAASTPLEEVDYVSAKFYEGLSTQEKEGLPMEAIPDSTYTTKPYRKGLNLFRFHSWTPAPRNFGEQGFSDMGIALVSQNNLSTVTTFIDYQQSFTRPQSIFEVEMAYDAMLPKLGVHVHRTSLRDLEYAVDSITTSSTDILVKGVGVNATLPLVLTKSHWNQFLTLRGDLDYDEVTYSEEVEGRFENRDQLPLVMQGIYQLSLSRAKRDIVYRKGLGATVSFGSTPFGGTRTGDFLYGRIWTQFKTFGHQGFHLEASMEQRNGLSNVFRQVTRMPYGHVQLAAVEGTQFVGVNYHFPLFYPDWNWELVYLQRFRGSLFVEHAWVDRTFGTEQYTSLGATLRANMNLLKYSPNVDPGIRVGYALEADTPLFVSFLFDYSI